MGAFITVAGENLIAQKQGNNQVLNITHFVLANIAGLTPGTEPVDRIEAMPVPGDIVDTQPVTKSGYVNANQVVYSLTLDSTIGDYDFNWVGLKADDDTLIAVVYIPLLEKRKTIGVTLGNNLVRNFLIQYSGIAAITATNVPADTWQIDFTTRLLQIDERERLSNFDIYGQGAFLGNGFNLVYQSGSDFILQAGHGYVGGIRIETGSDINLTAAGPISVWVDASLQGDINGVDAVYNIIVDASVQNDYTDGSGFKHYLYKLADIDGSNVVTDKRASAGLVDDHEAKPDPHPQYMMDSEKYDSVIEHEAKPDPHPQYLTPNEVPTIIPAGTKMLFVQSAAPTGWTQDTSKNDYMLRIVSGTGGGSGGTDSPILNDKIPAHNHTMTTDGDHSHGIGYSVAQDSVSNGGEWIVAPNNTIQSTVAGAHAHVINNNANAANWAPKYINTIIASKD